MTNHSLIVSEVHFTALKTVKYFLINEMSSENERIENVNDVEKVSDKNKSKNVKPFKADPPRPWYKLRECWIYLISVLIVFGVTAWIIIMKFEQVNIVLEKKRIRELRLAKMDRK